MKTAIETLAFPCEVINKIKIISITKVNSTFQKIGIEFTFSTKNFEFYF